MPLANAIAATVLASSASSAWSLAHNAHGLVEMDFETYVAAFGRSYQRGSSDFAMREELFYQTVDRVRDHNANPVKLWKAGLNTLSDRTWDELAQLRGYRHGAKSGGMVSLHGKRARNHVDNDLPQSVDWKNLTSAQQIADQGACGSCWAVAASSMMEARFEVATGTARTFSAQRLVDCVPNPKECGGSGGCKGATVELALKYVEGLKGRRLIDAEAAPYKGSEQQCVDANADAGESLVEEGDNTLSGALTSWATLESNKAAPLMAALVDGPVAVSVSAEMWFMYDGGIFDGCFKDAVIDHAVVMVGYGEERNTKFWTIRNSWGESWGEKGHIRLLRHASASEDDKFCGIDRQPEKGMACKPYPDSVRVCGMCGVLYDSVVANFGASQKSKAASFLETHIRH